MASGPTIVARFLADTKGLTSEVDKAGGAVTKVGDIAKGAAIALGGAFAVDQVVQFGKASVEAAAADAEAQAQLAAALRNTTGASQEQIDGAERYISTLSKQTAIADDELRPALANLARGFGDTQKAQEALSLATDISAGTGKDLAAVSEALMKAANGNVGGLSRLGIETKDVTGKTKSLDQIMADLSKTFGGQAALAAKTTAGQMRNAQVQMGELQEQIGAALLPTLGTLATFFTGTLIPAISAVVDFIQGHKDVIVAALIGLAVVVGSVVIPAFITWAAAAGAAAIATLAAAAPFIAIGAAIAAVAFLIIHNWDTIKAVSIAVWNVVLGAIRAVWDWISSNWPLLLTILLGPIGAAVAVIVKNWDTIRNAAMAAFNWVKTNWPLLLAIITGPIGLATLALIRNWDTIKDAATALYNWVADKFRALASVISSVVGAVESAVSRVVSAIKAPINAVLRAWNGISLSIPRVEIPSWVPGIGGNGFGGNTIDFPNVPLLASGAVLTSPTLFVGGEAGTEIVAPEDLLRRIVAEEAPRADYTLNLYTLQADPTDVAMAFRRLELLAGVR